MKINIIGAGVSGLSVGCYLQMNGYETEIVEKHSLPGGLCTSWKRGEFTFDGCIHWLLGSNESSPFYKLWSELIDMKSVEFVNHEARVEIELMKNQDIHGDRVFHLYTDLNRLETYLTDIAPEDTRVIKSLVNSMRIIQKYEVPPMIDNIPALQPLRKKMSMVTYLPFLLLFLKWRNVTNYSFARKLSNPFLKEAFELLFDGDEIKLLVLTLPLSFFASNGAGYPVGGSLQFARKIEEKYLALGGKIRYNQEVRKIITEGHTAKGLLLKDNTAMYSDIVISAADWHFTVFEALEGKFVNKKIQALAELKLLRVYPSVFMISLGVSRTFKEQPHLFRFPAKTPVVSPDGTVYERLESHIFHYDHAIAPEGKTIISLSLYTHNGAFWIDLRKRNITEYNRCKNEFANIIIDQLDEKFNGVRKYIEVMDVATPATYHRYTNNWGGSVQGWFPDNNLLASSPVGSGIPGLSNFYFSSHWVAPGGGLPMAIKTGRDLAQNICLKHKKRFIVR